MARPQKKESESLDARQALLEASRSLILANGFHATSINDVCKVAGFSKGTFFHYYADKQALALALLAHSAEELRKDLDQLAANAPSDPLGKMSLIAGLIARYEQTDEPCGCLIGLIAQECAHSDPVIRTRVKEIFSEWTARLQEVLEEVKSISEPSRTRERQYRTFDPKALAMTFLSIVEGGLLISRAFGGYSYLKESLMHFGDLVAGYIGKSIREDKK